MAGHSQFKNIMYRKGAQDARRAKIFTKIAREITISVKLGGGEPASNPRLRAALQEGRKHSMPKDNMERAVKKGMGPEAGNDYEEIRYEGMGPGAVSIIVETLTDNRNRTASSIRSAFGKLGGSMTPAAFNFERVGLIAFRRDVCSAEAMLDAAVEAGADDVETGEELYEIACAPERFAAVRAALEKAFGEPDAARLDWKPLNRVAVDEENAATLFKLLEHLEDDDDVQRVVSNVEISEAVLRRFG